MRVLRLVASIGSAFLLLLVGTTSAEAESHQTIATGFEVYGTSTQGAFVGSASGGLSGYWSILVDHSPLDNCVSPTPDPCAWITGGRLALAVTSPVSELVTGNFDDPSQAAAVGQPDQIKLVDVGAGCTNQVFSIADGLNSVGTGSRHVGRGSLTASLTHLRRTIFGRCVTYSATVKGTVVLDF